MYLDQDSALHINQLTAFRRDLHRHPELKYQESRTADKIAAFLEALGITPVRGLGQTGLVASIHGQGRSASNPGPAMGLRADMDALPLQEVNRFEHASQNAGRMHACGHDGHTAMLLGAAQLLASDRNFDGTVHLIFQPAEEGGAGAKAMMDEGLFERFPCQAVFALHNWPSLPQGQMAVRVGPIMASGMMFELVVRGKGGHAAMPHLNTDAVLIASHIVVALQQVVSRRANPTLPSVLSFGHIIGEGAYNVLPNDVRLRGTFRTMDETWRAQAHALIREIASGTASAMGAICDVEIDRGYPMLFNHPEPTALARSTAEAYLGPQQVVDLDLWMAAEDFAFYAQEIPASFYRLGTRNEAKGWVSSVHTSTFDVDESALPLGAGLMAAIALEQLAAPPSEG
jgi:hippurate hydrolase